MKKSGTATPTPTQTYLMLNNFISNVFYNSYMTYKVIIRLNEGNAKIETISCLPVH